MRRMIGLVVALLIALVGCSTPTPEISLPTATRFVDSKWIELTTPRTGDTVSFPISFRGRTNYVPADPVLIVRLYDPDWTVLRETYVTLEGEMGEAGEFSGKFYDPGYTGEAKVVVETRDSKGSCIVRITIE